jgi:hypothetical protein
MLLLCFGTFLYTTAQTVNTTFATQINNTLSGLDKSKVPHKLLKDQAMEFAELGAYNGTLTADNIVHRGNYAALYNTLLMARVQSGVPGMYTPQQFEDRWDTRREARKMVLSGMYYKYTKLKENAYPTYVNVSNNIISDKYVNGVWQNPYEEKEVFVLAPPILKYNGLTLGVKLPTALWYTNQGANVQNIAIDFSDGLGYRTITMDQYIGVSYSIKGLYEWKYRLKLTNGEYRYSHSKVYMDGINSIVATDKTGPGGPASCPGVFTQAFNGTRTYLGQAGSATLEIDYASDDCVIRKPLIVAEGFDSGLLGVENPLGENDYGTFSTDVTTGTGDLSAEIQTYDIIYVNWTNGRDHLLRNAYLLEEIIDYVNNLKVGAHKNVVLGQSMGGVIARYALKDMEDLNIDHDTRLYVSHDAPQQGANIPVGISYFARHIIDQFIETPLGDMDINVTGDGGSISIKDIEDLLDAPGTKQLLIKSVDSGFNITGTDHNSWQTILNNKGYPQETRNISLSNGNHCANPQPFNPGDNLFLLNGEGGTSLLTDFLLTLFPGLTDLGVITLANILNEPGLLVALLPGKSSFDLEFRSRALPTAGSTAQVYKGNITFTKKILFFNINVTITDRSFNSSGLLSYDYYPGGAYSLFDLDGMNGSNAFGDYDISISNQPSFDFIPVPSALDVGTGTSLNNQDYLNRYNAENPPTGNKAIPFDNFLVTYTPGSDLNEEHISFNTRNGNWLASELNLVDPDLVIDCSFFCDDQGISGPETICTSATYSVAISTGTTVTWSVSPSNAGTFTGQGTNQVQFSLSPSYNGMFTISTIVNNPNCGNKTVIKEIFGGKPKIEVEWYWDANARRVFMELVGANGTDITKQGVTANDVYWQKIASGNGGSFNNGNGFNRNAALPNNNSYVNIQITATNSCGSKVITFFATPPPEPNIQEESGYYDFVSNPNNLYTINYINEDISMPLEKFENPQTDFKIIAYDFTGNQVMETKETKIDLSNLKSGIYILKAFIDDTVLTKKVFR